MQSVNYNWIKDTAIGVDIRKAWFTPPVCYTDAVEIIYCLKGSITYSAFYYEEYYDGVELTLNAGEFIVAEGDMYYIKSDQDNIVASVYIDLNAFVDKYDWIKGINFACIGKEGYMREKVKPCYYELKRLLLGIITAQSLYENNTKELRAYLNKISEELIDLLVWNFDSLFLHKPEIELRPDLYMKYQQIRKFIKENFDKKITLKAIANEFNYTESHISNFLREIGIGYQSGVNVERVLHSEPLLLFSDFSILEISDMVGFSDVKYYYKAFKSIFGYTPKVFRDKYKELALWESVEQRDICVEELGKAVRKQMEKFFIYSDPIIAVNYQKNHALKHTNA